MIETGRFSEAQKREALEQLLRSRAFARADLLRRFLRYICECEIAGTADQISEHTIAVEAFGRPAGILSADDSSIRNRAHALRQKLEDYYKVENPDAPIRIEVRKGSYIPCYSLRPVLPPEPDHHPEQVYNPPPPQQSIAAHSQWLPFVAGFLGATLLAAAAVYLRLPGAERPDPVLQSAWGAMLQPHASPIVVVASAPSMLFKSFQPGTLPSAPRFLPAPDWVAGWYNGLGMLDGGGERFLSTTMNTVLLGDSIAASRAIRLLSASGAEPRILPEWGTRPLVLRNHDLIVIGSPNYSQLAARALQPLPLTVSYDAELREEVISEQAQPGPRRTLLRPRRGPDGRYTTVFGLLTVVPNPHGAENNEQAIIFSGITSAGPQAAMEFFSSPPRLRELRDAFAAQGHSRFPRSYQVAVETTVDNNLAVAAIYSTHRIFSPGSPAH